MSYLDENGLAYFWGKIKDYADGSGGGSINFSIVNALPTQDIDPNTVYLISTNFDPAILTPIIYSLSRSGNNIILTGSDGSTTTVNGGLTTTQVEDLIDETIRDVLGVTY